MTIKELKNFYIYYYRQVWFSKENSYYSRKWKKKDLLLLAIKLIERIPDATNAKQNYQLIWREKTNTKLVRRSKITITNNYLTTKNFEKPNTADKRSVTIYRTSKNFT